MSFELILPFLRPIESLLLDDSVSEIMGNPDATWWYERDGMIFREATIQFDSSRLRTGLEVIANLHRFANLVMRSHTQTTFVDTEAEIGESVDFIVHIQRQPGGRVIREILRMIGYDRDTKRFVIEPVFEVQHAAA